MSWEDAIQAHEGQQYTKLFEIPFQRPDGLQDNVAAVTPDGRAVVGRVARHKDNPLDVIQQQVYIMSPNGEQHLAVQRPGPARQITALQTHTNNIVWRETSSTNLYAEDWELYGYKDGTTRHLASSRDYVTEDQPMPHEYHPVSIDNDNAYLTVVHPRPTGQDHYTTIISVPLTGGPATTRVEGAYLPTATDQGLYYATSPYIAKTANTTDDTHIWYQPNNQTPPERIHTQPTDPAKTITSMCATTTTLAWLTNDQTDNGHGTVTIRPKDAPDRTIHLKSSGRASHLTCTDGIITWDDGLDDEPIGQYVYTPTTHTLWKTDATRAPGITTQGNIIAWCLPNPDTDSMWRNRSTIIVRWHTEHTA
jgi:hypothetical protein